jgi:hypothetical protein
MPMNEGLFEANQACFSAFALGQSARQEAHFNSRPTPGNPSKGRDGALRRPVAAFSAVSARRAEAMSEGGAFF